MATTLGSYGYWVHLLNQNTAGQPADLIAVKARQAYLIDAKRCHSDVFDCSRIEDNQYMAMRSFQAHGNSVGWFAIRFSTGPIYMTPLDNLADSHHITKSWCEANALTLEEWAEVSA